MFLKTNGFKRLIKEAYKISGLKVGNDGTGIYLAGAYWVIWIKKDMIHKKELGAIIELTGEIPGPGEVLNATKAGNQYEVPWHEIYNAMEGAEKCTKSLEETRVSLHLPAEAKLIQDTENGKLHMIDRYCIDIIDNSIIEEEETPAVGPLMGENKGFYWKNNVMAYYVCEMESEKAQEILEYLGGKDITK